MKMTKAPNPALSNFSIKLPYLNFCGRICYSPVETIILDKEYVSECVRTRLGQSARVIGLSQSQLQLFLEFNPHGHLTALITTLMRDCFRL